MKSYKTSLLVLMLVISSQLIFAQTWVGTQIHFSDPALGGNYDPTFIYRADSEVDKTKLRISMGDEASSDFEIGYTDWQSGLWNTTFSVDGNGKTYIRGNVGIGTTEPSEKLTVNGKIKCEELQVVLDVADYVFETNYKLRSLEEVEAYVKEHKHLPGVPGKAEVDANGFKVGDMTNKILEKVEELTLYIIEMKKENEKLKEENGSLSERLDQIEKLIKDLN